MSNNPLVKVLDNHPEVKERLSEITDESVMEFIDNSMNYYSQLNALRILDKKTEEYFEKKYGR